MNAPRRPFVVTERVRWADVDLVGIMRFSAFPRLVELAEQELLREVGLPYATAFDAPDVWMPRRALHIEYEAPVRLDEMLALHTYVSRMGETSLTLAVDVRRAEQGALVAAISMTIVCVTVADFRPQSLPEQMREALAPYVMEPAEARARPPLG